MKQVQRRALILLLLASCLALGLAVFTFRWASQGGEWVRFFSGSSLYRHGSIYDRKGVLLYNGTTGAYADDKAIRTANMQIVGDANVATSMRSMLADRLSGYNTLTGTAFGSHDAYLTVDAELNATAYAALNGKRGAVAVYNYKTGEILCMVSAPSFDPTNLPSDLDSAKYEGAYLNRVLSSAFPPGSIFKVVTAAAAIENLPDWQSFRYDCSGKLAVENQHVTCLSAHGKGQDIQQAFANSCNGAFGQLALTLGGDTIERYARSAGLLDSYDIAGVATARGQFDVAKAGTIDLAWSASGQYHDLVNPASFMMLMGGLANGGKMVSPSLVERISFQDSKIPSSLPERSDTKSLWSPGTCQILQGMMRNNVEQTYGQNNFGDLRICAKSGTAEVGGGKTPHAWFAGYLDEAENPLAFVVLVENGGFGGNVAGAVANKVLQQAAR